MTTSVTPIAATRESLAIEVDQGITGDQVVTAMNRIIAVRGAPEPFESTMGQNSFRARWINGLIYTRSHWTSADLANQPTMRSSNRSTDA